MSKCPNKASKEWQALVNKVGEFEANRAYIANGEEIPSIESLITKEEQPKLQPIIDTKKQEIKLKYDKLSKAKNDLKETKNASEVNRLNRLIDKFERDIQKLENEIEDLSKDKALEDIEVYAEADLSEVESIIEQDRLTWADMDYVRKKLSLWEKAGDFKDRDHLFFDRDEFAAREGSLKPITDKFTNWKIRAESLHSRLTDIEEAAITAKVKEEFGEDVQVDLTMALKDINKFTQLTLDVSEVDNAILQAMHKWVKVASKRTNKESLELFKQTDEVINKALPKLDKKNPFELFRQTFSNKDKRKTGDMVNRFTQKFFDDKGSVFNIARRLNTVKSWSKAIDWVKENELQVDVRKLFPDKDLYDRTFSTEEVEAHKKELLDTLGTKGYEEYTKKAKDNIEDFKLRLQAREDELRAKYEDEATIQSELEIFNISNSPYHYANLAEGYTQINGKYVAPSGKYSISVPKKSIEGKDTGYYDEKYAKIEADQDLLNLYNFTIETLKRVKGYLPGSKTLNLQMNSLPYIRKNTMEQLAGKGVSNGLNVFFDKIKESVRVDDLGQVTTQYTNPLTGEINKEIQTQFVVDTNKKVQEAIEVEKIRYKQNTGEDATWEQIKEFEKDIKDKLSEERSYDLGKLLKAYGMMGLAYHHKSMVADQLNVANNVIQNNLKEIKENKAGEQVYDSAGKPLAEKGLEHMKSMTDYFLNSFFGYPTQDVELKGKKKIYTKEEDTKLKDLQDLKSQNEFKLKEGEIDEEDYYTTLATLNKQIDEIGGVVAGNLVGNQLLKWIQLKGIAWNLFSGFSNMGFGQIANYVEAADGRNFNTEEYNKALYLTIHSIGKNATFNKVETGTAKKIRMLMDKMDILKETRNELFKNTEGHSYSNKLKQKFKWLAPYNLQARSEYINQAPIMIAMMLRKKVKVGDKEINLWEAFDEDGNLKYDIEDKVIEDLGVKVDKVIKINHGNYDPDSSLQIKQKFLGRAASQFRTWAFQGFSTRFEKEFRDNQLDIDRKGRYRTSFGIFSYAENTGLNSVDQTLFNLKYLLKKLTFNKAYSNLNLEEVGFSEVDAANIRKNLTELVIYMGLMAVGALIKAGIDDEDKKKNFILRSHVNFLLNQFNRLETDILFYSSPIEFEKLQRNALPIFSLVTDSAKWIDSVGDLLIGEDEYKTGRLKGQSKVLRYTGKLFPGTTQISRTVDTFSQVYD